MLRTKDYRFEEINRRLSSIEDRITRLEWIMAEINEFLQKRYMPDKR